VALNTINHQILECFHVVFPSGYAIFTFHIRKVSQRGEKIQWQNKDKRQSHRHSKDTCNNWHKTQNKVKHNNQNRNRENDKDGQHESTKKQKAGHKRSATHSQV
jgi:hypothetical protein